MKDRKMLFFFGAAIGAFAFLLTYGTAILDIGYDEWILQGMDLDVRQHYIGFLHYLRFGKGFPFGCMDTLSYPYTMSVVWTDSIPGLCVLAKLFKWALPEIPQLFGWFGLFTFVLNGGFAALLIYRVTGDEAAALLLSPCFILSYPVLQRMYYHTSLSAHFIIYAAMLYFLSEKKRSLKRRTIEYALFGFLCVSVHSYFLPMAGVFLISDTVNEMMEDRIALKHFIPPVSFAVFSLVSLYLYGAFSTPVNHAGFAIGGFNANLNTFFNSLGDGLLPALKNKFDTQYEGFCYLGIGVLLMAVIAGVILAKRCVSLFQGGAVKAFILNHRKKFLMAVMFFLFVAAAVFPEADLNTFTIIPDFIPQPVKKLGGVFRSNGRFIWPAAYILILSSIYMIHRYVRKKTAYVLLVVCVALELTDVAPYIKEKNEIFSQEYGYFCLLDRNGPDKDSYSHIIMTFDNGDLKMNNAYFAALNKKTVNRFYFARDIDEAVNEELEEYKKRALSGHPDSDCLYYFNAETLKEWEDAPLTIEKVTDDLFIGYVRK